jgi:hypothetical protein
LAETYDLVAIVDWSAASKPTSATKKSDAIWIGTADHTGETQTHFQTRHKAETHIRQLVTQTVETGRRALVGFDFAFGYPQGFAASLTGTGRAEAVWQWLAERIEDSPENRNNRFDIASRINALFKHPGPFWSHPKHQTYPALPFRKEGIHYGSLGVGAFRAAEIQTKGAKSPWMLYNPGAVGSQSLLGLPMIHRLSQLPGVHVWPFSTTDAPVVLAEVYPSLLDGPVAKEATAMSIEKDRAQVRLLARALWRLAQKDQLDALFEVPAIAREEGWILGAGHQNRLLDAIE